MTTKQRHTCGCGQEITDSGVVTHEKSRRHQLWEDGQTVAPEGDPSLGVAPVASVDSLPDDEQSEREAAYTFSAEGPPTDAPPVELELHHELKVIVESKQSPINKAKAIRRVFSYHDWPDTENPMTVLEVLVAGGVPYHETRNGFDVTVTRKNRVEWEKANK